MEEGYAGDRAESQSEDATNISNQPESSDNQTQPKTWKRKQPKKKKGGNGSRTTKGRNQKRQPSTTSMAAAAVPPPATAAAATPTSKPKPTNKDLTKQLNQRDKTIASL